jgi:diguanylate cyclase (GGDEF)-like protein/PAS domain S-box-containing protein
VTTTPVALSADANEEISELIRRLRETDERLDELTAGQIDTVADSDGRWFQLHHTQGELRDSDAAKQAAILNALPAHVILLDIMGHIISVNDAWGHLPCCNVLLDSQYGIGRDYLAVCRNARGNGALSAHRVAMGIRAVLSGAVPRYSFEHACQSLKGRLWFLLTVTPLTNSHPNGAVVMYVNITAQKRSEETSRRFAEAMNAIADAIYLVDRLTMRFVHVNDAACRMQNTSREKLIALAPEAVLGTSRMELELTYDTLIMGGVDPKPLEMRRRGPDGACQWIEARRQVQHSGDGWTIVTMVRDVTDRKVAENRIAYLNRVHAMLSAIHTLIVREHNRDELLKEACRIAVDNGGFRLAMMVVLEKTSAKVVLVGLAGTDDTLLTAVKGVLAAANGVPTPMTARAIRELRAVVSNDSQNDPGVAFAKKHTEFGIRSMAIFPLLIGNEVAGAFSLFADESQFFHNEEVKLLTELTNDVAFAIDHIEKKERLDYLAYYDVTTGLANRTLFRERVTQCLRSEGKDGTLALLLIDIQRFRNINDSLGWSTGDALLKQVSQWLIDNVGGANHLARVGVDLFALVLPHVTVGGELARWLDNTMTDFLDHSFILDGAAFRIAAKIGIAVFPEDGTGVDTLFQHAEAALKKAKAGGDRYLFYTQRMTEALAGKLTLENQLHQALDRQEFVLHYQPKVNLASGLMTGAEALIRWNDSRVGLILSGQFIPILEETGLIHEVGRWALRKAIEDHLAWRAAGLVAVRVAVNVSAVQLHNREFVHEIERAIAIDPEAAAGLELEITESLIREDIKYNSGCLRAIRAMGVAIAIDDFGTGFSSLSYLAKLPVHTLKIDRSFVTHMTSGPEGLMIVSAIIKLAHTLKLNVVAEGVETEQQARLLRLMKCDEMQGYLYSMPISSEILEQRFLEHVTTHKELIRIPVPFTD